MDNYRPLGIADPTTTLHVHFMYFKPEYLENFGWSQYVEELTQKPEDLKKKPADRATLIQLGSMLSQHTQKT